MNHRLEQAVSDAIDEVISVNHFRAFTHKLCSDERRSNTEKQMYRGVLEFICDLGLMYYTLHELSVLSQELQARSITLLRAEHLLKRTIRVIHSLKRVQVRNMVRL